MLKGSIPAIFAISWYFSPKGIKHNFTTHVLKEVSWIIKEFLAS